MTKILKTIDTAANRRALYAIAFVALTYLASVLTVPWQAKAVLAAAAIVHGLAGVKATDVKTVIAQAITPTATGDIHAAVDDVEKLALEGVASKSDGTARAGSSDYVRALADAAVVEVDKAADTAVAQAATAVEAAVPSTPASSPTEDVAVTPTVTTSSGMPFSA